jgi:peptide deformylase
MGSEKGTSRPIRFLGDPVLRTVCDPVTTFDADLKRLVDDMFVSMYDARGVGLAANQIGVSRRVFVYDCADGDGRRHVGHVINPVLRVDGELVTDEEGCLSVPGLHFPTPRHAQATVVGVDMAGDPVHVTGTGELARCLQHETGHLDGRLYIDTLSGDARRAALRAIRAEQTWT